MIKLYSKINCGLGPYKTFRKSILPLAQLTLRENKSWSFKVYTLYQNHGLETPMLHTLSIFVEIG